MKGFPYSLGRNRAADVPAVVRRRFSFASLAASITDPGSANAPFTAVIPNDLPEGNIALLAAVGYITVTKNDADISATFGGNIAVGSAPTADATLNGAEVDILPSTALATGVAGVSADNRLTNVTPVMLNNTDGSLELNLNGFIADASISGDGAILMTGYVELAFAVMGDD